MHFVTEYNGKTGGGITMGEPMYIRQTETESILGDRIVLYYFTTEKKEKIGETETIRYGIGIDMYTQLPYQRTTKERKVVDAVFRSKRDAQKFIDVLCDGCVTPATLEDIINDNLERECVI